MTGCIPILKDLIQIKTENPPGETRKIIEWIESWAKAENISVKTHWYEKNRGNIQLTIGKADKTILICGHLDTVPMGNIENWNHDPFGGEEVNGYIYGRGSADMKSGVAITLSALKRINDKFNNSKMEYNITFLGTSDEEVGLGGARASLELGILEKTDFLIIPEPTGLSVGIAEKGVLWLSIIASGKSAHGSTPEKGVNAIEELVKLFPILHSSIPDYTDDILGKSTLNIGVIQGGNIANVVPERAEIQCDFRLVPPIQPVEFSKKLAQKVEEFASGSPAKFQFVVRQTMPVIRSRKEDKFVSKFIEKSGNRSISGLNYATDGAVLVSNAPKKLPFVLYGPGNPKNIHIADEKVSIQEVEAAEQTFIDFLTEICFSSLENFEE
ncbi:MAG: M20 family metallopeptidase [Candidatus Hodarchaeales archaeon]|jgi:succinyl-diaminopimelate desuccinylase